MKRRLFRLSPIIMLVGLMGIFLLVGPIRANTNTTITVNTTADGVASDGVCTLREAILSANTDTAIGGCVAGSGADTIVFDAALPDPAVFVLTATGANENAGQTGDLDVSGTLTINGNGPSSTIIDGNNSDRVFELLAGATVNMTGVTIRNGDPGIAANGGAALVNLTARLTLSNTVAISNTALNGGGFEVLGRLTMDNSTVQANHGGGITIDGGLATLTNVDVLSNTGGYGVRNQNQAGLTFTGGLVSGNQGGGIANATATATVQSVSVVNNSVGGGLYNTGGTLSRLTVRESTIMSNTAASGAGIYSEGVGAQTDIYDSTIRGNVATGAGGGLFNNGVMNVYTSVIDHNQARSGGGVHHFGGNLHMTNVTISQNTVNDNGGGLYNGADSVLTNVTIYENSAQGVGGNIFNDEAQLSMANIIVANPVLGANCVNSAGFLNSLGHNLESTATCQFTATGDMVNTNPLLGPLQDNGGPTFTHALLDGSPAIDHGDPANCPATDQRGIARPQGPVCDIGAYEGGNSADLAIATGASPSPVDAGQQLTYTVTISNGGPSAASFITATDQLPAGVTCLSSTFGGGCDPSGVLTWTVPSLGAGASMTATIVISAPTSAGTITNTATVTSATPDGITGNNTAITVVTVNPPPDVTPPGPVGNLTASNITTQGATLTWDPAVDDVGVAGYNVYAKKDGVGQSPFLVAGLPATITSYVVNTLQPATGYNLWVVAFDLAGNAMDLSQLTPVHITTLAEPTPTPTNTPTNTPVPTTPSVTPTSTPVPTQPPPSVQLAIDPPAPTTSDVVSVTVSGVYTSTCVPVYQSHQITGHQIGIQSAPSTGSDCQPNSVMWGYTLPLGSFAVGPYTVTHTLQEIVTTAYFTVTEPPPVAPTFHVDEGQRRDAYVGEVFHYDVYATGTPPITYSIIQGPPGMTIDVNAGRLTWTPTGTDVGTTTVTVQATNAVGSDQYTLTLTVYDQHYIYLPVVMRLYEASP